MRPLIIAALSSLVLSAMTINAQAETVTISEKVKASILKRHPKAVDFQAQHEIHFGQKLLEVSFRPDPEDKAMTAELFRGDAYFFTDELWLPMVNEVPTNILDAVRKEFPQAEIKKGELIVNPNSAGEEYEIYLVAGGSSVKVIVDGVGKIISKENR